MKVEEIIKKLENDYEPYDFGELSYGDKEFGKVEIVKDISEVDGTAYRIAHFIEHGVYIQQVGYYCSYESYAKYEDSDYNEVFPKEEVITQINYYSKKEMDRQDIKK